jgi:hypothetical protein
MNAVAGLVMLFDTMECSVTPTLAMLPLMSL